MKRLFLTVGFLLAWMATASAQCTGAGGVPFNCVANPPPQPGDLIYGGSLSQQALGGGAGTGSWTFTEFMGSGTVPGLFTTLGSTGPFTLPSWTTLTRPTCSSGNKLGANTTTGFPDYCNGSGWISLGGGGGGGGSPAGSTGNVQTNGGGGVFGALTDTQLTTRIATFTSSLKGLVPPSGGLSTTFLNGAGGFSVPPGGGGSSYALPDIIGTYGADPTGAADSTTAFQNAAASGAWVIVEGGTYKISNTIPVATSTYLVGGGTTVVTVTSTSTSLPMFSFANGVNNAGVSGMTITRSVTPVAGAYGIVTDHTAAFGDVERITLADLEIENQWNGLSLGPTNYSVIRDLVIENCLSDGVNLFNTVGSSGAGSNPLQWTLDHVLSQFNAGHGFELNGLLNSQIKSGSPISVGEWKNLSTFANSSGGIYVAGSTASPFWGFRIGSNSFIGGDGSTEINLDSFGGNHLIEADIELAGQSATGPHGGTPQSNVGYGIFVSTNNSGVNIKANVNANSYDGIYCAANLFSTLTAPCQVTGSQVTNNGVALVSGSRSGITLASGSGGGMVVSGGYIGCWNESAGTCPQQYGYNIGTDKFFSTGAVVALGNNATAAFNTGVTLTVSCLDTLAGGTCNSGGGGGGGVSSVVGATGAVTLGNLISGGVAPLASPGLTGVPTAPTAGGGTNTTQLATTAFVQTALAGAGGCTFTLAPLSGGGLTTSPGTVGCTSSSADIYITPIANNTFLANTSGSTVSPVANNISTFMDSAVGATAGEIFYRGTSGWAALAPGTTGQVLTANGSGANVSWGSGGGGGGVTSIATGTGLVGGPITSTGTIAFANIPNNTLLQNHSGGSAQPVGSNISDFLDSATGATAGEILYRSTGGWAALAPGTAGNVLTSEGSGVNPQWLTPTSASLADPGFLVIPIAGSAHNYIRQWGNATISSGTSVAVTFPQACPTGILGDPQVTPAASGGVQVSAAAGSVTLSGFTIFGVNSGTGGSLTGQPFNWSMECF